MELAVLIGLQASGKTSFYRERLAHTHLHVSKDLMPHHRRKQEAQLRRIQAALQEGLSVAVDNTNPARSDRLPLLELGRAHGAELVGYYFSSSLRECLERNQARSSSIPEVGLFSAAARLERPDAAEGFHRLYYVKLGLGGFEVEDWQP